MSLLSEHHLRALRALRALRDRISGDTIAVEQVHPGIVRLRMSSRLTRLQGLEVSPYLVGGEILIDSGFAHLRRQVLEQLADRRLSAICCTHHHEDHSGNCGPLASIHDCPVYLHCPELQWTEGVGRLPRYRQLWWGPPAPYEPRPMPAVIEVGDFALQVVPTPGHSASHVALFEKQRGLLFSGDLYISSGASALMTHEDPYALARSLRRVAALCPAAMFTGHAVTVDSPESWLGTKAARIEEAAQLATELHRAGLEVDEIVRRLFPRRGRRKDLWLRAATGGEFSRRNFVRAAIRHRPAARMIVTAAEGSRRSSPGAPAGRRA